MKIVGSAPSAIKKHSKEIPPKLKTVFHNTVSYLGNSVSKLSNISKLSNLTLKVIKFAALIFGEEYVSFLIPIKAPLKTVKNVTGTLKLADKSYGLITLNSKNSGLQIAHKVTSFVSGILKTIKYCGSLGLLHLGKCASALGKIPVLGMVSQIPLGIVIDVFQFVVNVLGAVEDGLNIFAIGKDLKKNENHQDQWEKRSKEIEELIRHAKESAITRGKLNEGRIDPSLVSKQAMKNPLRQTRATQIEKEAFPVAFKMERQAELSAEIQAPTIELAASPMHHEFFEKDTAQILEKSAHFSPKFHTVTVGHVTDLQYDQPPEVLYDRKTHEKLGHFDQEKKQTLSSIETEGLKNRLNSRNSIQEIADHIIQDLSGEPSNVTNGKNNPIVSPNLYEIDPNHPDKIIRNAGEVFPEESKGTSTLEEQKTQPYKVIEVPTVPSTKIVEQKNASVEHSGEGSKQEVQSNEVTPSISPKENLPVSIEEQPSKTFEIEESEEIKLLQAKLDQQTALINAQRERLKALCQEKIAKANSHLVERPKLSANQSQKWQSKVVKWEKILSALEEDEVELLEELSQQFTFKVDVKKSRIEMFKQVKIHRILSLIYRIAKVILAVASVFLFISGIGTTAVLAGFITFAILTYSFGIFKFFWKEVHAQQLQSFKKFEVEKIRV